MEGLNKKLAYGLWAVSGISGLYQLYSIRYSIIYYQEYLEIIGIVVALVCQGVLGYTILRDKNDKFTMISVILTAIFTFDLSGWVAMVMRMILRKKKESTKIRSVWFIPAIVAGATKLVNMIHFITFGGVVSLILSVTYYLIFGYWLIKYLKVN